MELAPPPGKLAEVTHSWQTSVGMERQFGNDMSLAATTCSRAAATSIASRTT